MDIPAPGIRATCGLCPSGYRGDGLNCIGMSMCCHQSYAANIANIYVCIIVL